MDGAGRSRMVSAIPVIRTRERGEDSTWIWVCVSAALTLTLCPFFAGMVVADDDVGLLLVHYRASGLWPALVAAWHERLFRPLAVFSGFASDPITRTTWPVVVAQLVLAATAATVIWRVAARVADRYALAPSSFAMSAVALWLLHPSTAVSLWQMDTLSQTASASLGLALIALHSRTLLGEGSSIEWASLGLIVLGVLSKETFLGWLPLAILAEFYGRDKNAAFSRALLLGGVLALAFAALRLHTIGASALGSGQETYSLHLGFNTLRNVGYVGVGLLSFGPLHALRLYGLGDFAWWFAATATLTHATTLVLTLLRYPSLRAPVASLWLGAILATGPVLLMGHVSELYLMGPNALTSLALAISLAALRAHMPVGAIVRFVLVAGAYAGLGSRAYHFGLTWSYARELTAQAVALESSTRDVAPDDCAEVSAHHSVYVISPLMALQPLSTEQLARARGAQLPTDWPRRLECSGLHPRRRW